MHNEQTFGPFDAQVVEHTQRLYLNRLINSAPLSTSNQELNSMFEYEESRYQYLLTILRSVLVGGHARVAREQFRKTVRSIREATNVLPARPDQVSYLLGTASELFISDTEIELIESGIAIAIAHDIGSVLRILLKAKNTSFIETMSTAMLERMTTEEDVSHLASDSADEPIHTDNDEQSEVNAASETAVAPDTIRVFHLSKENRAFLFSLFDKRAKTSMLILHELLVATAPLTIADLIQVINGKYPELHLADRKHTVYTAIRIIQEKLACQRIVELELIKKSSRNAEGRAVVINEYRIRAAGTTLQSYKSEDSEHVPQETGDDDNSLESLVTSMTEGTMNAPLSRQILNSMVQLGRYATVREITANYSNDINPSANSMSLTRRILTILLAKFPEYLSGKRQNKLMHYGFVDSVRLKLIANSVRFEGPNTNTQFSKETAIFLERVFQKPAGPAKFVLATLLESTAPLTLSQLVESYKTAFPNNSSSASPAVLKAISRLSKSGKKNGLYELHITKQGRFSMYSITRTSTIKTDLAESVPADVDGFLTKERISASDLLCIHGYIDAHKEALTKIMPDFADLLAKIQVATDTNTAVPPKGKALKKERQQILGRMLKLTSNELEQFSDHGEDARIELIKLVQLLAQLLNRSSEHPEIELITYIETHVSATIAVEGINVQGTVVQ